VHADTFFREPSERWAVVRQALDNRPASGGQRLRHGPGRARPAVPGDLRADDQRARHGSHRPFGSLRCGRADPRRDDPTPRPEAVNQADVETTPTPAMTPPAMSLG